MKNETDWEWVVVIVLCLFILCLLLVDKVRADEPFRPNQLARVVCDGQGSIRVDFNEDHASLLSYTVWIHGVQYTFESEQKRCAIAHEEEHRAFIEMFWPGVCKNEPDGSLILLDPAVLNLTECMAYMVSLECLDNNILWARARDKYRCDMEQTRETLRAYTEVRKLLTGGRKAELVIKTEVGFYIPAPAITLSTFTKWRKE